MSREELFIDILGGLDEKYVALAMPRSCGHDISDYTRKTIPIKPVEVTNEVSRKESVIYWVTRSLGIAAAAFLIIGAAVLLIMNWDKIAVREPDRPGIVTTQSTTSTTIDNEPDKYDPFLYYSDMDMPEPFAQSEITELYYGGTDGWHGEFYNLWKNDFYRIDDYLQKYVGEERAMEVISGYKAEQFADNQAGNITRYRIDDTQNWYRFAMDTGLTAYDFRRARQMADENWSESRASMVQEDIFVTFGSKEKIAENNKTEYCISVGEYVFNPRWLYYHTAEDYKAAGITPRMINDMLEKYKTLGLTDEAWIAFRDKLYKYISGEKDNTAVTTSAVTESNGTTAVAVTCETTTSDVIGDTTVISDTDSSADTTVPADDRPTDDELKSLVEQGAEACGLKITVSDLKTSGLMLNYSIDESVRYADKLEYTWYNRYQLETPAADGSWVVYDPDNVEKTTWWDGLFDLGGDWGNETTEKVSFYGQYSYDNEIPNGHYRIVKNLSVTSTVTWQKIGYLPVYAEFDITDDIPNLFDIAISVKDATPDGAVLVVTHGGHNYFHNKVKLGYKAWFIIEMKTGSGEWKKVDGNPVTWAPDVEPLNENGVTEIKQDFSYIYGSLSDGTYRISMQFVNYGYTAGELTVVNCSTYYCEFVIGEKTHDWGITMSAKDVTSAGMTLVIDRKGGDAAGKIDFGEEYHLEIKNDENGMWERLRYVGNDVCFVDIATMLDPGAHIETKIDWTYLYSYLPAGHYRFVKQFTELGSQEDCDFYLEFDVPETVSKLGISLYAKSNTARGITLDAVSIGDTVSERMGFNENSYVIEQKKNGKWAVYYTTAKAGVPTPEAARKINVGDVVSFTVDWRGGAGNLPVGEYRIGFIFTGGSVSETIYAQFNVKEYMTNEFGLQIRSTELSRTGGKFGIDSLGGDYSAVANYGNDYELQIQTSSGSWKSLSVPDGFGWTEMFTHKIQLTSGGGYAGVLEKYDWSDIYGTLSAGHYRLVKKFSAVIDGKTKEITLYCEFDITADTPEKITE